jgi:hypothetical protein
MEKLSRTSRSSEVRKTDAWPPSSRELLVQSGALGLTASLAPAVTSAAILSADRWPLCSSMIAADGKRFHVLVQGSGPAASAMASRLPLRRGAAR